MYQRATQRAKEPIIRSYSWRLWPNDEKRNQNKGPKFDCCDQNKTITKQRERQRQRELGGRESAKKEILLQILWKFATLTYICKINWILSSKYITTIKKNGQTHTHTHTHTSWTIFPRDTHVVQKISYASPGECANPVFWASAIIQADLHRQLRQHGTNR